MSGFDYGIVVWRGEERMSDPKAGYDLPMGSPERDAFWSDREDVGRGRMRIFLNKTTAYVRFDGKDIPLEGYRIFPHPGEHAGEHIAAGYAGVIGGYAFGIYPYESRYVAIVLVEPDGTVWRATGGYAYGEGWAPYK